MSLVFALLVFIVFQGANAQEHCIPEPVTGVNLGLNYVLTWNSSTNCDPTHYLIYVRIEPEDVQYIFGTDRTSIALEFLPSCERFIFDIRAFSNADLSEATRYVTNIPAPPEADLTITTFEATAQSNSTFLRWLVTDRYSHCARGFRVVIYEEYNTPRDIYTANNYLFINNLTPCGEYQFAVMAIYNLAAEGPIALTTFDVPAVNSSLPVVEHISAADTYVNVTWALPPFEQNRCQINRFEIEGLPYYHENYPVRDSPQRPLFTTRIGPLQPEAMYIFRAYVHNSAGSSKAFPFGVQTRPSSG